LLFHADMRPKNLLILTALFVMGCSETSSGPVIQTIIPERGPLAGGNQVTITGVGFAYQDTTVSFGGNEATEVAVLEEGSLRVTVPEGASAEATDVVIVSEDGVAFVEDGYSYNALPTIASLVPDRGSHLGTSFSITGTGFENFEAGETTILVDGAPCTDVSVQSDTAVVCNAPAGAPWSLVDVTIENDNGAATAKDSFGYMKEGLFAIEGRGGIAGTLYFVDTEDMTATAVGGVGVAITGLVSHLDGTLYGVTANATAVNAGFPRDLVTIDPFTGAATTIGPLLKANSDRVKIPDIALEFTSDVLYGWSKVDRELVTIDLTSGEVTLVGGDKGVNGGGLAFDYENNVYLSADGSDGELLSVVAGTGVTANAADLVDAQGDDINSMTFLVDTMYGIREGIAQDGLTQATILVEINLTSGAVTPVMDLPFGADGLSRTPPLPFM
jgi:hypothetical protein